MAPTVSVIIPTYNCEPYIAETLGSVLGQSFKDLEIIVVDDGSTDRTREIVADFGEPVRLVTQQNARVCAARNNGIAQARGRFICLLDHDDWCFPDKLALQLAQMNAHPEVGVVYGNFILWHRGADGRFPDPAGVDRSAYGEGVDSEASGWIYHQFLIDCWMLTSSAMFRREVFERCGNFDVDLPFGEDWDLWLRLSRTYPFLKLHQPAVLYRQHPAQGNRVPRPIDYRTRLLEDAVRRWGYASPDGRAVDRGTFHCNLARYHAAYARHQLLEGDRGLAVRAFTKAWRNHPGQMKYAALVGASLLGWTPRR